MTKSVLLTDPGLTFLLAAAFFLQLVLQRKGCRSVVLELLPSALCAGILLKALLLGAEPGEIGLVLCGFFILSLTGRHRA